MKFQYQHLHKIRKSRPQIRKTKFVIPINRKNNYLKENLNVGDPVHKTGG